MESNFNGNITIENYGSVWHIDHVIPLSHFDLENESEQQIAFNWRNTSPLLVKDNLSKNKRLDLLQIKNHLKKLVSYHREKNLELPQKIIDLFAKHLVDGNPLKQSLPLTSGNFGEDLG
jgi:hypothetical protein